jgi:hypothetical protein
MIFFRLKQFSQKICHLILKIALIIILLDGSKGLHASSFLKNNDEMIEKPTKDLNVVKRFESIKKQDSNIHVHSHPYLRSDIPDIFTEPARTDIPDPFLTPIPIIPLPKEKNNE